MAEMSKRMIGVCPLGCSATPQDSAVLLPEGVLLCCPECGQLFSRCTQAQYEDSLHKWDTSSGTEPDARSQARYRQVTQRRLQGAKDMLAAGSEQPRLLDVGCSSGALLGIAREMGFAVAGVEPAARAARAAQDKGYEVFQGYLEDAAYADASFDVVVLFELLEHLTEPCKLLAECSRILKPGGVIVLNTPNAHSWTAAFMQGRWQGFSLFGLGGHISFFSPVSMRVLAGRTGFEVVRVETRNVRFYEKGQCGAFVYRTMKILADLLAWPAKVAGRGHDLLVYMRRKR